MNLNTYLLCFLTGLLGIFFHLVTVKIPSVKKQSLAANLPFTYLGYLKDDALPIISSLCSVLILLLILDELIAFKPAVLPFVKVGFAFVGFTGSSILLSLFSRVSAQINRAVDWKTDVADGKIKP
jgi:hypothetical protein